MLHVPPPAPAAAALARPAPVERRFNSHDGAEIFFRAWPASGERRGAIVLLHRGHEHGGRMAHLVDELDLPDFAFYAWDARGHGRSAGRRGDAPSFSALVRDLDAFVGHVCAEDGLAAQDIAVVAQSVGAVVAAAWAHDHAPAIRALVLASPAFDIKLYVPFAKPGIRLLQTLRGSFSVNSYVKARFLSHDPDRIRSFENDPLVARPIASHMLLDLSETAARVTADARAIATPTQLLISGRDFVVRAEPQHRFFENLGAPVKERHVLPGFFHDTLGERDRAKAVELARRFLLQRFSEEPVAVDLTQAHRLGFTRDEADRLETPLPAMSPRGLRWRGLKAAVRFGGRLSRGLALGREAGFDSGAMLDYVYRNQAEGRGALGRALDRIFLDAIGWRGIRQRKLHFEELLLLAMARLRRANRPVRLLDVAAGHGRYVLDALAQAPEPPESVRLRDWSERNVEAGRALIAERGLDTIARFDRADAFDRESLAGASPRPTLAAVSGLYELFADNDAVGRSLAGLADAVEPGGLIVYSNQPWHPQLEFIARCLHSHRDGRPWVMRRRTQGEMDGLVAAAGFRKIEQRIDRWGIFSVSLAERI